MCHCFLADMTDNDNLFTDKLVALQKMQNNFLCFFLIFFSILKVHVSLPIRSSNHYTVSSNFDNNFIIKMYGPSSPLLPVWGVGTEWAARTRAQLINHEHVDHLHLSSNF